MLQKYFYFLKHYLTQMFITYIHLYAILSSYSENNGILK